MRLTGRFIESFKQRHSVVLGITRSGKTFLSAKVLQRIQETGGHTLFRDSNDKKIIAVEPLLNRGVLFDSKLEHRGLSPYRNSNVFRIAIAYKFKLI